MVTLNWDEALDAASALAGSAEIHSARSVTGRYKAHDRAESERLRALAERIWAAYESAHVDCPLHGMAPSATGMCPTCSADCHE